MGMGRHTKSTRATLLYRQSKQLLKQNIISYRYRIWRLFLLFFFFSISAFFFYGTLPETSGSNNSKVVKYCVYGMPYTIRSVCYALTKTHRMWGSVMVVVTVMLVVVGDEKVLFHWSIRNCLVNAKLSVKWNVSICYK